MKKAKQKPISNAMRRLLAASEPAETQAALRQLRRVVLDAPPENRDALYDIAEQKVRNYAIAQAMKLDPEDRIQAIHQELTLLKPQLVAFSLASGNTDACVANLFASMTPFSYQLSKAETPEAVHQLIQNALAQASVETGPTHRKLKYLFVLRAMENAILDWYWQVVGERGDVYLSSLFLSLTIPHHNSLALPFLRYDAKENAFSSVAPTSLADVDAPGELKRALTHYRTVLQKTTKEEVRDCGRELKKAVLLRLVDWLDDEGLTQHRDIGLCADQLQKLLNGELNTNGRWQYEAQEPFSQVLDAINSSLYLGVELDDDALDASCADQAELLTRCFYSNQMLVNVTEFTLVCRILQAVKLLKVELPPALDLLVRTYWVMCLSGDCMLSDDASFQWIVGEDAASLAA